MENEEDTGYSIAAGATVIVITLWMAGTFVGHVAGPVGMLVGLGVIFLGWLVSAIAIAAYRAGARK